MAFCRDSPSLDEMTPCNEQNGPIFILQCRFEVLGGKIRFFRSRRMMASSCEMLALRFMGFRSIFAISKILQRPLSVRGLFFARRYRREAIRIP